MSIFGPALLDAKKNMFSPAALLTGGASLAVTGTKAMMKGAEAAPAAPAPQAAAAAAQPTKAPSRPASGGGAGMAGALPGAMLTGPGGITPSSLNLGKNTLLGQ